VRRVLAPHFTPARVRALEPVVRAHAEALVGTFAANGGGDFVAERFGGILVQLALAGQETTRAAAANGTRILAEQPEVRAGLIAEPSLVPGAVEEVLRYRSPVHYTRRTVPLDDTGEPAVIAGRTLDPGSIVYLSRCPATPSARRRCAPPRGSSTAWPTSRRAPGDGGEPPRSLFPSSAGPARFSLRRDRGSTRRSSTLRRSRRRR